MDLFQKTQRLDAQIPVKPPNNSEFQPEKQPEKQPETLEIHIKQIGSEQYTVLPDSQELDWNTAQKLLREKKVGPLTIFGVSEDSLDLQKIYTINWGSKLLVSPPTIDDLIAYSVLLKQNQIDAIPENLPICSIYKTEQGNMGIKISAKDIEQIKVPESQDFLDFKTIKDTAAEIIENPSELVDQFPVDTINSELPSYTLNRLIMIFGEGGEGGRIETKWLEEFVSKISFKKAYQIKDKIYYLFSVDIDKMTKREEVFLKIINYLILKKTGFKNTNLAFKTNTGTLVEFDSQAFRGTIDLNISKPVISAYLFAQKAEENQVFTSLSGDVIEINNCSDTVSVSLSLEKHERTDFTTGTILEKYFFYLPEGGKTEKEFIDGLSEPLKSIVKGVRDIYGDEAIIAVYHPNFSPRMYHTQGLLTIANILQATQRKIGDYIPSLDTESDKYMVTPFLNIPPKRVFDGVVEKIVNLDIKQISLDKIKEYVYEIVYAMFGNPLILFNNNIDGNWNFGREVFKRRDVDIMPQKGEPMTMGMDLIEMVDEETIREVLKEIAKYKEAIKNISDKLFKGFDDDAYVLILGHIDKLLSGFFNKLFKKKNPSQDDIGKLEVLPNTKKVISQLLLYLLKINPLVPDKIHSKKFLIKLFEKYKVSQVDKILGDSTSTATDIRPIYDRVLLRLLMTTYTSIYEAIEEYKEWVMGNLEEFTSLTFSQKKNLVFSIFNRLEIQYFIGRYALETDKQAMIDAGFVDEMGSLKPFKLISMDENYKLMKIESLKLIKEKFGLEFIEGCLKYFLESTGKTKSVFMSMKIDGEIKPLYFQIENNDLIFYLPKGSKAYTLKDIFDSMLNVDLFAGDSQVFDGLVYTLGCMLQIGSERRMREIILNYMQSSDKFVQKDLEIMHVLSQGLKSDDYVPAPKKGEVEYGYPVCAKRGFAVSELVVLPHNLREYIVNTVKEAPHKELSNLKAGLPDLGEVFFRGLESIVKLSNKN